jgi:hypothetical protein
MDQATELHALTDRELVMGHRTTARVEFRRAQRHTRSGYEYRVIYDADPGNRPELGPWCGSEERAWAAACLRLGLRLHPKKAERNPRPGEQIPAGGESPQRVEERCVSGHGTRA